MKEIIHIYIYYMYNYILYELYSGNYINILYKTLCIIIDHCKMKEIIHIYIYYMYNYIVENYMNYIVETI